MKRILTITLSIITLFSIAILTTSCGRDPMSPVGGEDDPSVNLDTGELGFVDAEPDTSEKKPDPETVRWGYIKIIYR